MSAAKGAMHCSRGRLAACGANALRMPTSDYHAVTCKRCQQWVRDCCWFNDASQAPSYAVVGRNFAPAPVP